MEFFVDKDSIIRKIWGKGDTVLFVFAGASAEFALNKAVDWLYFTGRLPADPIGRLFSTVIYSRQILFSDQPAANRAIDKITAIHSGVEANRGAKIPDWAYRDVLFMLIHYSVTSYEVLERKLTDAEKEEVFQVFYRMGMRMGLKDLPLNFNQWLVAQRDHLEKDLERSKYSIDLYKQYRKHLGGFRYWILLQSQKLLVPPRVKELLNLEGSSWMRPILVAYKLSRSLGLDWFLKSLVLPKKYKKQVKELDVINTTGA